MATMKLFRCGRASCQQQNRGRFEAAVTRDEDAVCPQCGLKKSDPKFGKKLIRLVMVHFDPPSEFPGQGLGHRACESAKSIHASMGAGGIPNPWHAGTGNPAAVTCPVCKATETYKAALADDGDDGPQMPGTETATEADAPKKIARASIAALERLEMCGTRR